MVFFLKRSRSVRRSGRGRKEEGGLIHGSFAPPRKRKAVSSTYQKKKKEKGKQVPLFKEVKGREAAREGSFLGEQHVEKEWTVVLEERGGRMAVLRKIGALQKLPLPGRKRKLSGREKVEQAFRKKERTWYRGVQREKVL